MRRVLVAVCLVLAMFGAGVTPAQAAPPGEGSIPREPGGLEMYTVELSPSILDGLRSIGYDIIDVRELSDELVEVDIVMNQREAALLRDHGTKIALKRTAQGQIVTQARTLEADNGFNVWRNWSEENGIRDEVLALAEAHPDILKLVKLGESVNGEDILALKLTADANRVRDGKRPASLYVSAQHAREWITVQTNLRVLHHLLDNYGSDAEITEIVDTNELWFVLVANPDGYDYTFTDGNRLWRKNLADNNGDGVIDAANDGVDLNRNFSQKWGYDNEGSSDQPGSQVYRGPSAMSEPETRALDQLMASIDFAFLVNWHSAAELLLYGIGWQVATPSPDDNIMAAIAGTDQNPAVPGYDPDLSAELYITNGTTDDQAHGKYGILGYVPELDTCESAEDIFPDDAFGDTYCEDEARSGFEFPDDEALINAVFEKNLPYALNIARSTDDPTNPTTNTGLQPEPMVVDSFDVSHGSTQEVAVETQREYKNLTMLVSINGGREKRVQTKEWKGGDVYGGEYNTFYAEYRGRVTGANVGDSVTVRFTARDVKGEGAGPVESESFTYVVEEDSSARVLIVANEDYRGFGPQQPGVTAPLYVQAYADALEANNVEYEVWDVTEQGVPHDLGVLSHYKLVIWELGDNRLTQDAEDAITDTFLFGPVPDISVAERQQYLTIAIRDYLNEGGKLFHSGEYTAYYGNLGAAVGGAYYGLNGDETAECVISGDFFGDCLIYSDDFAQYYLGIWGRQVQSEPGLVDIIAGPTQGSYEINGAETPNSGSFTVTSDILDPATFPQFRSRTIGQYATDGPGPFEPFAGDRYAAALHADSAWMRLSQTVDLSGAASGQLDFKMSYDTEGGYDHVIVEARPVGTEDWTTLPDIDGATSTQVPTECEAGFFVALHPDLANYFSVVGGVCQPTGATGSWNSFTGSSGGWTDVAVDLSAYAGQQVEVAISYVTDPASSGIGVFVDEAFATVDGVAGPVEGFETDLGPFTVPGPPATSPGNGIDWVDSEALFDPPAAAISTRNTITSGFGFEAIATPEERAAAMREILTFLLR